MFDGLFESKRFWMAVATILFVLVRDKAALPVTEDQVNQIVMAIAAWIVGDSLRATTSSKAKLTATS